VVEMAKKIMYITCGRVKYIAWQRPTGGSTATAPGLLRTAGGVQHGSTATCPDPGGLECTLWDGDLRRWTAVDGLPADGMQEVWGSNPNSSTQARAINRTSDPTVSDSCTAAKYRNRRTAHQFGSSHRAGQAGWPGRRTPEPGTSLDRADQEQRSFLTSLNSCPRRGNAVTLAGRATGRADDDGARPGHG
jgi:hypothetical protein